MLLYPPAMMDLPGQMQGDLGYGCGLGNQAVQGG